MELRQYRLVGGLALVAVLAIAAVVLWRDDNSANSQSADGNSINGPSLESSSDGDGAFGSAGSLVVDVESGPTSRLGAGGSFTSAGGPIRAAFYYPWFPDAWRQHGVDPFTNFTPSLGEYSSSDPAVIERQLALATTAYVDAFVSSWWGQGHHTDQALPALLDTTVAQDSPNQSMKWAVYYEQEGQRDPSVQELVADLRYLSANYFDHPAYLAVDGKPVVFVWTQSADGPGTVDRWKQAKEQVDGQLFVVLKVFSGFRDYADQADSWHQYGPAKSYSEHLPYSATVSPGFWRVGDTPRLDRDAGRFRDDVATMNASGAFWQLVTTWNEWGEGSAIEPADEFGDEFIEVLADNPPARAAPPMETAEGGETASESAGSSTSSSPPAVGGSVRFTAGGDIGANERTDASLDGVAASSPRFHLALGDLGYSETPSERAWCDYVKGHLGDTPVQLVVGNHEDDDRPDGYIGEFVKCLPDRMGSTGTYGSEYFFDVDGLVRVIMIGAGNDVAGVKYDYDRGSPHYEWLVSAIDGARAAGVRWVVVGMHKVCITAGEKPCEVGTDVVDLLIEKRVDLVLHGHEHNYQRSKQVTCVEVDRYRPDCVADDGEDGVYRQGAGLVWVVAGNFGGSGMYEVNRGDPEFGYLAAAMGGGDPESGRGFLTLDAGSDRLDVRFVGSTTSYSDSFSIHR